MAYERDLPGRARLSVGRSAVAPKPKCCRDFPDTLGGQAPVPPTDGVSKKVGFVLETARASNAVVGAIPANKPFDTDLNRRGGSEADVANQFVDVGISLRHVARLHRQEIKLGLAAQLLL
jgi:hypothetical protein